MTYSTKREVLTIATAIKYGTQDHLTGFVGYIQGFSPYVELKEQLNLCEVAIDYLTLELKIIEAVGIPIEHNTWPDGVQYRKVHRHIVEDLVKQRDKAYEIFEICRIMIHPEFDKLPPMRVTRNRYEVLIEGGGLKAARAA